MNGDLHRCHIIITVKNSINKNSPCIVEGSLVMGYLSLQDVL